MPVHGTSSNHTLVAYRYDTSPQPAQAEGAKTEPKRHVVPDTAKTAAKDISVSYFSQDGEDYPLLAGETFVKALTGGGSGAKVFVVQNEDGQAFVRKYDVHAQKTGHGIKALADEARTLSFMKNEGSDQKGNPIPFAFSTSERGSQLTPEAELLIKSREELDVIGARFPAVYQRGVVIERGTGEDPSVLQGYILDQEFLEGYKLLGSGLRDGSIEVDCAVSESTALFDDLFKNGYTLNLLEIGDSSSAEELFNKHYTQRVASRLTDELKQNTDPIELSDGSTVSLKELFDAKQVVVNGRVCGNPLQAMEDIIAQDKPQVASLGWSTHGDLNLSNIMTKPFAAHHLIDMRGFKMEADTLIDVIKHQFGCRFTKILDEDYQVTRQDDGSFSYVSGNEDGEQRLEEYKEKTLSKLLELPSFKPVKDGYPDVERRIKIGEAIQFLADVKFGRDSLRAVADFLEAALLFEDLKTQPHTADAS